MVRLRAFLVQEKRRHRVFPPGNEMFNAFALTPFDKVKVVLLGQDPYHGSGQAHGLCFSVRRGVPPPPSLVNIFRALTEDLTQLEALVRVATAPHASFPMSPAPRSGGARVEATARFAQLVGGGMPRRGHVSTWRAQRVRAQRLGLGGVGVGQHEPHRQPAMVGMVWALVSRRMVQVVQQHN